MANNIYIDGTANGDGAAAADWSLGRRPIAGDTALFTTAGVGVANNCIFIAPMTCDGLVLAADYGGDVDLVTHNFTLEVSGCTLDGGGTFDMGTGEMKVQVIFDNQHQGTFDDGTSTLTFTGDADWIGEWNRPLAEVTINGGVTTTIPATSGACVADHLTVDGELAITTGKEATVLGSLVTGAAGDVSGAGLLSLSNPDEVGDGITAHAGVISCAELQWFRGNANAILVPGTYAPTLFRIRNTTATVGLLRLSAGTYNFNCDIELENTNAAGSQAFDCATNGPTVNLTQDVQITETAGECIWSGEVNLTGLNDQAWDGAGTNTNPEVEIDKTTSGDVTFTNAIIMWSAAGIDMAGDLILTSGDFNGGNNPDVTCNAIVADCNDLSLGNGDYTLSDFDNQDVTAFTDDASHVIFAANGDWHSDGAARTLFQVTINLGVTTSIPVASGPVYISGATFTIAGELAIAAGRSLWARYGVVHTGAITGLGTFRLEQPGVNDGFITQTGTITCGELQWYAGSAAGTLAPGTYAPTVRFWIRHTLATPRGCTLSVGTYNFNCNIELENTNAAGSNLFDCTAATAVNITGDVLFIETAGTCIWTGTIILGGLNDQQYDGDAVAAQPDVAIDKTVSGDVVFLDADIAWAAAGIDMAENLTLTSGDFDGATNDPTVTCADLIMDCNNVTMGGGLYTISGTFDNQNVTAFADNTSQVTFAADGDLISNGAGRSLNEVVINVGVTTTIPAASDIVYLDGNMSIVGTLSIANTKRCYAYGSVAVLGFGEITGLGMFRLNHPQAGDGITILDGTITCGELHWHRGDAGGTLIPGTYAPTIFRVHNNLAQVGLCRLSAGVYNFNCEVILENETAGGSQTFDCDTNAPTVNITGDVTIIETAGTAAWTGTIVLVGGGDPNITMDGVAAQPSININSAGGTPIFIDGWAGATFLGTAGAFDPNGQTLAASGNFTTLAGFETSNAADVMNGCTITVGGNLSLVGQNGTLLRLLATAAWTLTVTGSAVATWVEVEYSNALAGTTINAQQHSIDGGNNFNWLFARPYSAAAQLIGTSVLAGQMTNAV